MTAPPDRSTRATFAASERFRRGRLLSVLLLGFFVIEGGAVWQYVLVDSDHPAMIGLVLFALATTLIAGALNRLGHVTPAALLLTLVAQVLPLAGIHATATHLDLLELDVFYLLVGSELVAASVLAPWTVFPVACVNSLLIAASIALTPHAPALQQLLASNDAQQVFAGPIVMQLIVAMVAYVWARSVLSALRRADGAETIAELERREVARTHELEEGVRELLAVHVHLANGNFTVRAPAVRNAMLWQIGNSLNNLIGRFARLAHAEFTLQRTAEEAARLADAVRAQRGGQQPLWPAPSGTPLDPVLLALADRPGLDRDERGQDSTKLPGVESPFTRAGSAEPHAIPSWLFPQPSSHGSEG